MEFERQVLEERLGVFQTDLFLKKAEYFSANLKWNL